MASLPLIHSPLVTQANQPVAHALITEMDEKTRETDIQKWVWKAPDKQSDCWESYDIAVSKGVKSVSDK